MDQTDRTAYVRTGVLYLTIAVVLLAAIVVGVRWAKNRSDHYASNTAQESSPEQNPENQTPPDVAGETTQASEPATATQSPPASSSTADTHDHTIPSTGPADTLLVLGAMGLATFAGAKYLQARRRLFTLP